MKCVYMTKVHLSSVFDHLTKPPFETYMLINTVAKEKVRRAKLKAKMEEAGRAGR